MERLHDFFDSYIPTLSHYADLGWPIGIAHGVTPGIRLPQTGYDPSRQYCGCKFGPTASDDECTRIGKHPVERWKGKESDLKRDLPAIIREAEDYIFRYSGCLPNFFTPTTTDLAFLDVDSHADGADGPGGLAELTAKHGMLPRTATDSRGHYLFRMPSGVVFERTKIDLVPAVELFSRNRIGAGHLLYISPSQHKSGAAYSWLPGLAPWEMEIAPLPEWIVNLALDSDRKRLEKARGGAASASRGPSPDFSRHDFDRSKMIDRATSYTLAMSPSIQGQNGNSRLFAACCVQVRFGLEFHDAFHVLADAFNPRCVPEWSHQEISRCLDSAYASTEIDWALIAGNSKDWKPSRRLSDIDPANATELMAQMDENRAKRRKEKEADKETAKVEGEQIAESMRAERLRSLNASLSRPPSAVVLDLIAREQTAAAEADRLCRRSSTISSCGTCFRSKHIIMASLERGQMRVAETRCMCYRCEACYPLKIFDSREIATNAAMMDPIIAREEYEDTAGRSRVRRTVTGWSAGSSPRFVGTFPDDYQTRWRIKKQIERSASACDITDPLHFFCSDGNGSMFVMANVGFTEDGCTQVSRQEAAKLAAAAVKSIPCRDDVRRPISMSPAWRRKFETPSVWKKYGGFPAGTTRGQVINALNAEWLNYEVKLRPGGLHWIVDFDLPGSAPEMARSDFGELVFRQVYRLETIIGGGDPDIFANFVGEKASWMLSREEREALQASRVLGEHKQDEFAVPFEIGST